MATMCLKCNASFSVNPDQFNQVISNNQFYYYLELIFYKLVEEILSQAKYYCIWKVLK